MPPERTPAECTPLAWGQRPALFVYYRVHSQNMESAVLAVQQQQHQLRAGHPGLQAMLMHRSDADLAQATLMEIYVSAAGDVHGLPVAALAQEIESAMARALHGLLAGPRHTEEFMPCA